MARERPVRGWKWDKVGELISYTSSLLPVNNSVNFTYMNRTSHTEVKKNVRDEPSITYSIHHMNYEHPHDVHCPLLSSTEPTDLTFRSCS